MLKRHAERRAFGISLQNKIQKLFLKKYRIRIIKKRRISLNPNKKEGESRRFCIVLIQKVAFSGDIQVFEKKLKKIEKKY